MFFPKIPSQAVIYHRAEEYVVCKESIIIHIPHMRKNQIQFI